jgi:hypothetical protein
VWLSTVAVLLGGEVDEQIEKQTDEGGRP